MSGLLTRIGDVIFNGWRLGLVWLRALLWPVTMVMHWPLAFLTFLFSVITWNPQFMVRSLKAGGGYVLRFLSGIGGMDTSGGWIWQTTAFFNDTGVYNVWKLGNSFLPLDTMLAVLGLCFMLWFYVLMYRFIKSWLPTVSG